VSAEVSGAARVSAEVSGAARVYRQDNGALSKRRVVVLRFAELNKQ
jgi:hypothetical protein